MKLELKSPAKINLGLFVVRKREDGYHDIETLFQMVGLYDDLIVESRTSGVSLQCEGGGIAADDDNLALRAARLLQERVPEARQQGCHIHLKKNIPAGAGLGGGSGNAALVLWALNRLWDLKMSRQDLQKLAAELGSDVPFFLASPAALGSGRGEILEPIEPIEKTNIIVVFPRLHVATAEVYRALNLDLTTPPKTISILLKFFSESDIPSLGEHLQNDLEPIVLERFPEVRAVRDRLASMAPEGVLLSGSGSAVFALFRDRAQAESARAQLQDTEWDVYLTETVASFSEFLPETLLHYP